MSRYIDADQIRYMWQYDADGEEHDGVTLQSIIRKMPTADVVEVVRCKDCKHCTLTKDGKYNPEDIVCGYFMTDGMQANDFCSYGERSENGT